jgi:predicted ribosomally synthesized peptide with SipW-like signal peptide
MRSARKHLTKIAATVALVAGAAGVAGVGTFGAYTDTTAAETKVDSGKVSVLMNGYENGISITKSKMAAGDVAYVPITIERQADSLTLGGLTVSSTISGELASTLTLRVETCTAQVPADGKTCTGSSTMYNGPLSGAGPVSNYPLPADWVTKLNSDAKVYLRATLSLPSNAANTTQSKSATVSWSVVGTQRAAETTAITPVPLP